MFTESMHKLAQFLLQLRRENSNLPLFNARLMQRCLYFSKLVSLIRDVEGSIVECGVGQGRGLAMWTVLAQTEGKDRLIWAFDSFEGFPKLSREDDASAAFEHSLKEYRQFDIPYVLKTLDLFGIPKHDIDRFIAFAKGFIPESLALYDRKPVALLHIDLDIYESNKEALRYFWEYVSPGGIIAFDEYNKASDMHSWPGAQKAINEFLDEKDLRQQLVRDPAYGRVYLRKSG